MRPLKPDPAAHLLHDTEQPFKNLMVRRKAGN